MHELLGKLKLPLIFIAILLLIVALIHISEAYNNYWTGKLAEARYNDLMSGKKTA